ncbi:hypothetical protein QEN19_001877 [Hanseniaspora menglaensis]
MGRKKLEMKDKLQKQLLKYINPENGTENEAHLSSESSYPTGVPKRLKKQKVQAVFTNTNLAIEKDTLSQKDWDGYRMQFQKSYDASSQIYYDALDSPSKVAEEYNDLSSNSEDTVDEDIELFDSSGDEIIPPSQHDFEIIKIRKKKQLLQEMYHINMDPKSKINQSITDTPKPLPVIALTLSQLLESDVANDSGNNFSFITFSDDDDIIVEKIQPKKSDTAAKENLSLLELTSSDDSDCIILSDSQVSSPVKNYDTSSISELPYVVSNINKDCRNNFLQQQDIIDCSMIKNQNELQSNINIITNNCIIAPTTITKQQESLKEKSLIQQEYLIQNQEKVPQQDSILVDNCILKKETPEKNECAEKSKILKPKATDLNKRLKNMGIKLSNQEILNRLEGLPTLRKKVSVKSAIELNAKNIFDIKLNLIATLNYVSSSEFIKTLNNLISETKRNEGRMQKLLENNEIASFFLNISIAKPWCFTSFKILLVRVITKMINLSPTNKELETKAETIQLLDNNIIKEWCEDDLGVCFEMSK